MKKFFAVLLAVIVICTAFVACSKKSDDDKETKQSGESVSASAGIATDEAKIKESEAIDFIKTAYSEEELGLDKVKDKYSLMVAQSAIEIEGKKYVKVAANVMSQNDETNAEGQVTYSLTPVGEFYISFDGKTVLKKDMETGEYTKLENKYDDYYKNKTKDASTDVTKKKSTK